MLLVISLFDARSVAVAGAKELPVDVVKAVAAVPLGTPMLRLDTTAISRRVAAVPRVASVQVRCSLDGTVRIEITERIPVAVVRRGNGLHLVDATGTDYATVPLKPPGLPELRSDRVGPRDAATVAALTVLARAARVAARPSALDSRELLPLTSCCDWATRRKALGVAVMAGKCAGAASRTAPETVVLGPLLTQPGKVYDGSSPALPTVA